MYILIIFLFIGNVIKYTFDITRTHNIDYYDFTTQSKDNNTVVLQTNSYVTWIEEPAIL